MSIRAYICERNQVDSERDDSWKYEEYILKECLFNLWRNPNIFDLFINFGFDGTNGDCVGQLELTDEQFEDFVKNKKENTKQWNNSDLQILKKIERYFKEGNWLLQLECF